MGVYATKMAEMADPVKLTKLFEDFSERETGDPTVQQLHRRMQEGDEEASYELQQLVADEAWGGRTCVGVVGEGLGDVIPIWLSCFWPFFPSFCHSLNSFILFFPSSLSSHPPSPVIDLKAFGVDGIMPKQLTAMRDIIKDKDPAVWEMVHQNEPIMERILTDPMAAKKMVQETLESLRAAE